MKFSIHRKLFSALKKLQIVKITPPQVRFTKEKKSTPSKISDSPPTGGEGDLLLPPSLTTNWKTLDCIPFLIRIIQTTVFYISCLNITENIRKALDNENIGRRVLVDFFVDKKFLILLTTSYC